MKILFIIEASGKVSKLFVGIDAIAEDMTKYFRDVAGLDVEVVNTFKYGIILSPAQEIDSAFLLKEYEKYGKQPLKCIK